MWVLGLLCLAGLATWQAVEIIRHSDLGVMVELRRLARLAELGQPGQRALLTPLRAVLCGWCVSVWVGCAMALLCLLGVTLGGLLGILLLVLPFGLAASRCANVANDLMYRYSRTPKADENELERYDTERLEAELVRRLGEQLYTSPEHRPEIRTQAGNEPGQGR